MSDNQLLLGFGIAIVATIAGTHLAKNKGRSGAWGTLCFFFPPLILLLAILPSCDDARQQSVQQTGHDIIAIGQPASMAAAGMIAIERRERGMFGRLAQVLFWLWQAFCLYWIVSYLSTVSSMGSDLGTQLGAILGSSVIGWWWFIGTVSLGIIALLTRGEKVVTYRRADSAPEGTV